MIRIFSRGVFLGIHYTVALSLSLSPPFHWNLSVDEGGGCISRGNGWRGRKLWVNVAQRGATAPAVFIPDSPGKQHSSSASDGLLTGQRKRENRPKQRLLKKRLSGYHNPPSTDLDQLLTLSFLFCFPAFLSMSQWSSLQTVNMSRRTKKNMKLMPSLGR